MINIKDINYEVILVTADGKNIDLSGAAESIVWEQNKGELATRITVSLVNTLYEGKSISSYTQPGTLLGIIAEYGGRSREVARGTVIEWSTRIGASQNSINLICYDELFNLQKSQDNIYYAAGTGTKTAIKNILTDWGVEIEKYDGPNETHAKLVYKSKSLSDILLDILEDAVKKGAQRCVIRSNKGKVQIIPRGSNVPVYHFSEDNTIIAKNSQSVSGLVTRVKVLGKADDDGKSSIEAVLDGKTEFGIRQKIVMSSRADSLEEAKKNAQEILDEEGDIEKTITIESPDVPEVQKGDLVHIDAGNVEGYYYIIGIRHNVKSGTMSMDLEDAKTADEKDASSVTDDTFEKGDRVILNGAVYLDSFGNGKGMTFNDRTCTITIKVDTSRKCPYHVDGIGWVYPDTIRKA